MAQERAGSRIDTFKVLLAGALVLVVAVFLPLWKPLFLALVLAGATGGLQRRLTRRLRGRRKTAAGILLLGLLLLVLVPVGLLTTYLVTEVVKVAHAAIELFQTKGIEGLVELAPDRLEPFLRQQIARLPGSIGAYGSQIAQRGLDAANAIAAALSSTGTILFQLLMMLVALYFLLVDGPALLDWLRANSPLGARLTTQLMGEMRRTATSVLSSTVATAAVQSVVATVGYLIARVPVPLVFGFLTFLASFIPSIGTAAVGVPIGVVLLLTGHWVAGIFLLAWMLLVAGTVDNVLKPWLARGGAGLHGAVVFFAMIGGILMFGALGLIIGPTVVSLLVALVRIGRSELRPAAEPAPPTPPPPPVGPPARPEEPVPAHRH